MDSDTLSTNLLKVFCSFAKELTTSFPEYESVIYENYNVIIDASDFSLEKSELMIEFMDRIHKISKRIKDKDENIFSEDILLLTGVSFKAIWESKINEKTKGSIWKYLQTFTLLDVSYRANDELKTALDSLSSASPEDIQVDKKNKGLVKDLKSIKALSEEIQSETVEPEKEKEEERPEQKESSAQDKVQDNLLNPLEEMIKNSEIGKIAEEVSNSIDMDDMLEGLDDNSDMSEVFGKLVSGGGIGKIFTGINQVVNDKIEKEDFSKDDLQKEAMDMCENMGQNVMSQLGTMMGGPSGDGNPFAMFQQMAQQMHPQRRDQMRTEMEQSSNPTRDRLQKKLAERKNKN